MKRFVGREQELEALKGLLKKKSSSLVVIRGRRRVGKSRLAEEFGKSFPKVISLSGVPPTEGVTAQSERDVFFNQLKRHKISSSPRDNWGDLFHDLAQATAKGKVLIILDEITWMGSKDPLFLPQIKTMWDLYFKKNPGLIMILSGSNSSWIEKNILSSTGFFGRVSLRILLEELSLPEANLFWSEFPGVISPYEKFKILSVTGGIPRYLEELRPDLSAEGNLQRMCFQPEGILFREFEQIFHDLFLNKGPFYKQIIRHLLDRHLSASQLARKLSRSKGGDLSAALEELVDAGFLSRDYTWDFVRKKRARVSRYRVRDNYIRFYLKYIEPNALKIESGKMRGLPEGWHSILGLQFENLVINSGTILERILQIPLNEIICAGPYLQTSSTRRKGCQIDYLIQEKFNTLHLCEVKFKQGLIGGDVIEEVKAKMKALKLPRGFSCRPVLVHVNGVDEMVPDSGFFSRIVDFSEFLQSNFH